MGLFIILFVLFMIGFGYILFKKSWQGNFRRDRSAPPPGIDDADDYWTTTPHLNAHHISDNTVSFTHHTDLDSTGSYTSADPADGFGGGDAGGGGAGDSWDAGGSGDFSGGGDFGGGGGDTGGGDGN